MRNILLVARREFRQIASLRSFWLTLLLIPFMLAAGPLLAEYFDKDHTTTIAVIDRSGGATETAIRSRFAFEQDLKTLQDLSDYARRYDLAKGNPKAVWARNGQIFTPADALAFRAGGGLEAALEQIRLAKPAGIRPFKTDRPDYEFVTAPPALARLDDPAKFEAQARALFAQDKAAKSPDVVLLIGPNYPQAPVIQLYTNDRPGRSFLATLQAVLTNDLQRRMLGAKGLTQPEVERALAASATIAVSTPPPGKGLRDALLVRSAIPLLLSFGLLMGLMLSGSWMLQGSVEERSNKLIEGLLACISPEQLMYGKLVGTLAIGLTMFIFWTICAGIATYATQGIIAEYLRPALAPLSSPRAIVTIIYFFLTGYVAISVLFMAIGALSDSMSDAQGFLMPLIFALMLPVMLLQRAIVEDKMDLSVQILTWIPIWTPFTVLARLGSGIAAWEVIGSGLLLAAFVALEVVLLGRLFRNSLLSRGQKAGWRALVDGIRT